MPTPKQNKNGVWSITAAIDYQKRKLTLGMISKEAADVFASNLNLLISYRKHSESTPPNLKQWIDELTPTHRRQLSELGLIVLNVSKHKYTINNLCDDFIKYRLEGKSESTITEYEKGRRNLIDCFGDVPIGNVDMKQGREFFYWLKTDQDLAENTAKQRLRYARTMFSMAVEDSVIDRNPFKARGLSVTQSAAKKDYITDRTIEQLIDISTDSEWQLFFTMTRCVPMRIPSEYIDLTWSDVDWGNNKILIHSPKTRHLGKHARLVPIFPRLRPALDRRYDAASKGELYIFEGLRLVSNIAELAKDKCRKAKIEVWCNFWNSVRASAETDLMDRFGLRRACQWSGNSAATAMKNYALVKNTDFDDSGENHQKEIFATFVADETKETKRNVKT